MKIIIVVMLALALVGCISGLVGPQSDQADSQIGAPDATQPQTLAETLQTAVVAGLEAANASAKESPAYQAGKQTAEGILGLLSLLGVSVGGIGAIFGIKKAGQAKKSDQVATATVAATQELRKTPQVAAALPAAIEAALSKLSMTQAQFDAAVKAIKDKAGIASVGK